MISTILLVAGLIPIKAERALFAIRYDCDLFWTHPSCRKIIAGGLCAFIAQYHVVVTGPSFIAMPFNPEHRPWMILQVGRVMVEGFHSLVRQSPLVITKKTSCKPASTAAFSSFVNSARWREVAPDGFRAVE